MGILASKTVGSVVYIRISEPYPLFSAATNYVAINPNGDMFVNVPYSSQWFSLTRNTYSELQAWNTATTISIAAAGYFAFLGTEFSPTATTTLNGFTRTTAPSSTSICLSANTDTIGRFITTSIVGTSTPGSGNPDQIPIETQPALNNALYNPTTSGFLSWGFGSDCSSDQTNGAATQYGQRLQNIDGNAKDYLRTIYGAFTDGLTTYGNLVFNDYKLTAFLLEKPVMLEYQNFESGTLGNWNAANENQTNKWIIGTGTSANGSYSAYISSGGTLTGSNIYNATATSISHLYADVKFPMGNFQPSASTHNISFVFRVSGATAGDYGTMYLCPSSYTPTGGTFVDQFFKLGVTTGMTPSYLVTNGIQVTNGVLSGTSGYVGAKVVFSGLATSYSSSTTTSFNETWESGSFSGVSGGWTVANGAQTNKWNVGSGTSSGGTFSLYVTSAATGTSAVNLYNVNAASIVHIYRTIVIPSSATSASLSFNWRCVGENAAGAAQYDYGTVVIADTGTTPTAGAEVSTAQAAAGGNGRIGATTNLGKFNLNYVAGGNWNTETIDLSSYVGLTKRLVFTWVNDGSVGTNPPMALDNIVLTFTARALDPLTPDSDGYVTNRIVLTWQNDNTTAVNPPLAVDNLAVYSYVGVPNDKR
jgi:hypothetical protein